ncbi:MAG: hypothetical protein KME08_13320 [Aphanothece sp. CMT-3BRIN-NPC111]|nr:hypothetical protein [Aphanothece sp. CMT-3BRIN-NPC111]
MANPNENPSNPEEKATSIENLAPEDQDLTEEELTEEDIQSVSGGMRGDEVTGRKGNVPTYD